MTTSTERSLDDLLTLSYSDMSDEEIARVIEYKAAVKAQNDVYVRELAAIDAMGKSLLEEMQNVHESAVKSQNMLLQAALRRLSETERS